MRFGRKKKIERRKMQQLQPAYFHETLHNYET